MKPDTLGDCLLMSAIRHVYFSRPINADLVVIMQFNSSEDHLFALYKCTHYYDAGMHYCEGPVIAINCDDVTVIT